MKVLVDVMIPSISRSRQEGQEVTSLSPTVAVAEKNVGLMNMSD